MARTISVASQALLDQNLGTEPALILDIQWVDGGSVYTYSDKDITSDEGKILSVSGLDNTTVIQGVKSGTSGDSQQISVTLDDTNGDIKTIIDSNDIHKQSAWVYQWFEGLATTEKFLIFKGQISSPIQWNEGDRTVSFDIITRIEDAEVGFSMEEGNFDYVPEDLVGEPWPLVFGTVTNCPALRTRSPRKGTLKTGFGIRDYMLAPKKEQAALVCCPWRFMGFRTYYSNVDFALSGPSIIIEPVYQPDVGCECKKAAIQCEMDLNIAEQSQFEFTTIDIIDGELFPQAVFLTLDIAGAKVGGTFAGTPESPSSTFNVANYIHPKKFLDEPSLPEITSFGCDARQSVNDNDDGASVGTQTCSLSVSGCVGYLANQSGTEFLTDTSTSREQAAWNHLATFEEAGFFWGDPGTEVILDGDNELVYIANLLPSTVHLVKAYRTFGTSNFRQLVTVPNTYYTVRQSDFNSYTATELVFEKPLSQRGEGWEDDIFVSQTSTIGPNPVSIMEWLITTYTNFTWDSSFATVKTTVDNYPMNFMVPGRMNIFKLLQEMAFQGRMALLLRDDEFSLIYLSEEPSEVDDITESDVLANSLILDHTDTEDLVTKFVAKWRPSCELDDPYQVILRYNINRYGTQEQEFDFYCYNIQELVIKSSTFWLIRMANTWRKIICKTPINKLKLESLDGIFVTLPDIATGEIKCRVESATYNSGDNSIDFVIQTPIRAGELTAFPFHYPANISVEELHPTDQDLRNGNGGGSGPNVDVVAPAGHILGDASQFTNSFNFGQKSPCGESDFDRPLDVNNECRPDQGDQKPTDVDDTKPTKEVDADNSAIPASQSPVNSKSKADLAVTKNDLEQQGKNADLGNQLTAATNTGTGSTEGAGANGGAGATQGGSDASGDMSEILNNLPTPDQLVASNTCVWSVGVQFITVTRVYIDDMGNTSSAPGTKGCFVGNQSPDSVETFSFGTESEQLAYLSNIQSVIDSQATVGQRHPVNAFRFDSSPPGCIQSDNVSGETSFIGYENSDGVSTVVGVNGFMTGVFDPSQPNGCGGA